MLLQFDATSIFIAISFLIFMFVMQILFYGPMTQIRKERQNYIDSKNKTASDLKQEVEKLQSEHESKILSARLSASKEVSTITNQTSLEKNEALAQENLKIAQKINEAREKINNDKAETKTALKSDVLALAHMISKKVLGEDIPISGVSNEMIDNILK